jgi:hypothetical protein
MVLILALVSASCVAPKFLIDIPANSTPAREERYYRTHDAANATAGFLADEAMRRWLFRGPTDHVGVGDRQIGATDSVQPFTFPWRSGESAPVARMAVVAVVGTAVRQTDKGYRESGLLFNLLGAFVNEWLHFFIAGVRGHF